MFTRSFCLFGLLCWVIISVTYQFWERQSHNQCSIQSAVTVFLSKETKVVPKRPFLKDFGKFAKNRLLSFHSLSLEYDYDDIEYPIPFNELYHNISNRYVNYGQINPFLPTYILTGDLPVFDNQYSDILVMTGASDNHAHGAFMMMYSVLLADPYASLLFVDLGFSEEMMVHLKAHFETMYQIQTKMKSNGFLAYRKYNWDSFPEWMDLQKSGNSKRGGYSWKVIPIYDAFFQWKGMLSWLDSGAIIIDGFSREFTLARRYGYFAPPSVGTIGLWTHKDTVRFMKEQNLAPNAKDSDPNCSAGIAFMDYSKPFVHEMISKYTECAYTQKCMAPKESTLKNHRFDQAVLSMLISEYKIPKSVSHGYYFHPAIRNEKGNVSQIFANILLPLQQAYHISLNNRIYDISKMKYNSTKMKGVSRKIDF